MQCLRRASDTSGRVHLELRQVTKSFDQNRALDDFSLTIPPGSIVAVIGLNGAGKTTLLRSLAGLVAPTRGEILFDAQPFRRDRLDLRRELFFLPDFPVLFAQHTPLQHLSLLLRIYERDTASLEDTLIGLLRDFDLLALAQTPIGHLSRGQIYKTALAALVAVRPALWLLDEPFASGLDPQGLAMLKHHARTAAAAGATILYSTQILEIAERFSDLLCVVDRGRLQATYTRAQLAALPAEGPDSLESRLRQFREVSP